VRPSLEAARGAGEELELLDHHRDFVLEHGVARLARVGGFEVGDLLRPLLDHRGDPQQRPRPLNRRDGRPAPVLECRLRRRHRAVNVGLGRERRLGDHLAGGGIDDLLGRALRGVDRLPADEVLQLRPRHRRHQPTSSFSIAAPARPSASSTGT
jgi:hypothetical protein